MSHIPDTFPAPSFAVRTTPVQDARNLQALLYREIGISAVAAALFMSNEMDRPVEPASTFSRERLETMPPMLRGHIAA